MKALFLSLALLTGDTSWPEKGTEMFVGLTCASLREAEIIAATPLRYNLANTVEERTHCIILAFNGRRVGESADFNIGDHIFSFLMVEADGHTFYVLQDKGEGWVT